MRKTSLAILTLASFSLAACETTGGNAPPLVTYTQAERVEVAKYLREHPKSDISKMIVDYAKTRKAIRATRR